MDLSSEVERLDRHAKRAGVDSIPLTHIVVDPLNETWRRVKKKWNRNKHKRREPVFFTLWMLWLLLGTVFYAFAPKSGLGIVRGFYMAINIGYSIGFGFPSESEVPNSYLFFSSFYVLLGASFVGVALSFFAEKITKSSETWFTKLQHEKEIEEAIRAKNVMWQGSIQAWIHQNSSVLKAVSSWLVLIIVMIIYSMIAVGWPFQQAQYFAISTLSTGGHWSIPQESPDWLYGVTGIITMIGVPLMALAMAEIAQGLISRGVLDEAMETIDAVVTKEELEFLLELGLEDFDGKVDRAEFIILCMVRIGNDPGLIKYITQRFAELNFYTGEALTVAEITQGACKFHRGKIRRAESVQDVKKLQLKSVSEHQQQVAEASKGYLDFFYNGMDNSASSTQHKSSSGELDFPVSPKPPARNNRQSSLPAVHENLSFSQQQKLAQKSQSCAMVTLDMESQNRQVYHDSLVDTKESDEDPGFCRNTSLDLFDVFGKKANHSDGPRASLRSSARIPRRQRSSDRPMGANQAIIDHRRRGHLETGIDSSGESTVQSYAPSSNREREPSGPSAGISESAGEKLLVAPTAASDNDALNAIEEGESGDDQLGKYSGVLPDRGNETMSEIESDNENVDGFRNNDAFSDEIEGLSDGTDFANGSKKSDDFLDEMEEARSDDDSTPSRPNALRGFLDSLEQECSVPYAGDNVSAKSSSVETYGESSNDGRNNELAPKRLNYANFLFSRESESREVKVRHPREDPQHAQGSPGLEERSPMKPTAQGLPAINRLQNGHHHEQFSFEGNRSRDSDSSVEMENFKPGLPKKSFSSYLVHR